MNNNEALLRIIHFNDVYDIQPNKKGNYGVVNFQSFISKLRQQEPNSILLFSGDAFSPSILSSVFEGKQMIKALNKLKIDVACFGNHEFDFDPETSEKLIEQCNFKWLLGNIKYKDSEFCLGNGIPYLVKELYGLKIGFFGVAGEDWMGIFADDYEGILQYIDVGQHSKKMCKILKQQQKCDLIIALTHMRTPQDRKLPFQAPDIDIILGGHDHIIMNQFINGIPIIKSGDNFKTVGVIDVYKKNFNLVTSYECKNFNFNIEIKTVPKAQEGMIDVQLRQHVQNCMNEYNKNDRIIGYTDVELETRFSQIRTKESNYGNFMADLVRLHYNSDCCVLVSGSVRNDKVIKPGPLTYSMISNIINDQLVVKEVPGSVLLQMLQYSCSQLPDTLAGSFLFVSGIKYSFDYRKHPRVQSVQNNGIRLDPQKLYSVATHHYASIGGDGYNMMKQCKFLIDNISGIDNLSLLLKFFKLPHKKPQNYSDLSNNEGEYHHHHCEKKQNQIEK